MAITDKMKKAMNKAAEILGQDAEAMVNEADKALETNRQNRIETNAQTDIMNTGNVGFGKELVTEVEYTDELYDMVSRMPGLLSKLPGNYGQVPAKSFKPALLGETGLFDGASEPTGSYTYANITTDDAVDTDELEVKFKNFKKVIAISKDELAFSRLSNTYTRIQNRILLSISKTMEAYAINADTRNTDTPVADANVNFYDVDGTETLPTNAYWYGLNNGIRYQGIENTGLVGGNVAFGRDVLLEMQSTISDYMDDESNLLWIFSGKVGAMLKGLADYSTIDKFGANATNTNGGFVMRPEGIEAYNTPTVRGTSLMPALVGESGKVEVSAGAANDYRTAALVYKYAFAYGFGRDIDIVVHETSDALMFDVNFQFGLDIANGKAQFGKTIAVSAFQK